MGSRSRFLFTLAWFVTTLPAAAATFTVNDTADAVDAVPGDGTCATAGSTCTLRAAIQEANAHTGPDTIMLPAGAYLLTIAGQAEDAAATGDLDITDDLTIAGASTDSTILDGNGIDRIFDVFNTASHVEISGLTIRNGNPGPGAGGLSTAGYGGGIYNSSVLALSNVIVTTNTAAVNGGGIENDGDITLIDCVVSGNSAAAFGGGIDSALTASLTNVTVSGNMSGAAGGIGNDSEMMLGNVTVSGNTAMFTGGGIQNDVTATLANVTIADNGAQSGGGSGFYNLGHATFGYVIVANGPSGDNCAGSGSLTSQGHNLDSGNTCGFGGPGDLADMDPQLGPLQDNGGSTPTQALSPGSPAIDAGGNDCPPPATDQRGLSRPEDGNGDGIAACDIGAYELGGSPPACPAGPTFPSIACRLDELIQTVQTVVAPGTLRDRLDGILTRAKAQVGQAEQALANGKKHREKSMLGRATGSLGQFKVRLRSRKAQHQIPGDALAGMKSASDQLRHDLVTLRRSS